MQTCPRCGAPAQPSQPYCTRCGAALAAHVALVPDAVPAADMADAPGGSAALQGAPAAGGGLFVWSLALLFLLNPAGTPLGALAAFFCCAGHAQTGAGAARCARTALALCIAGSICTAAGLALLVLLLARQAF